MRDVRLYASYRYFATNSKRLPSRWAARNCTPTNIREYLWRVLQNFKFGTRIRPRFNCHQLYIVIIANGCGYTQGLFWLPGRIILVSQENQIEATQNLPDVCFLDIRSLFCLYLCQRKYNAVSAIAGEIWQYRTGVNPTILTKITTLLRKVNCEQLQVLAAKHTASLQLLSAVSGNQARSDTRSEFKILEPRQRGGSWSCTKL